MLVSEEELVDSRQKRAEGSQAGKSFENHSEEFGPYSNSGKK